MIRLEHLSGSLKGTTTASEKRALRVGTSSDADIRYDPQKDPTVTNYHAAIILRDGGFFLLDVGSATGSFVNDKKVSNQRLNTGDRIRFGGDGGPELRIEIDLATTAPASGFLEAYDPEKDAAEISRVLKTATGQVSSAHIADLAAKRIAEARAQAGGQRSRKTLSIMANTLTEVQHLVGETARKKWVKVVAGVAGVGLFIAGVLSIIVYLQHAEIAKLLSTKAKLDGEIQAIQEQMQAEQDSVRLDQLEQQLNALTGSAETTLAELSKTDEAKAAEVAESGDELDKEIRRILTKFDAKTYAVPPIFKDRLQYHINSIVHSGNLKSIYTRKVKFWPVISKEFSALGMPEEMAYVAWQESKFDPQAVSTAGARGMWQMTTTTAQSLGLRVDGKVDERLDVRKQTRAAARYLANLLAEFGEDSFMLAMASYNRGENGVRRALHQIALEPGGFKKEKREFWHLYRLKKLPDETREYVPKILAAAIICNNPERYGLEPAKAR